MLTQSARPKKFSEVAGQETCKALLKAIIKNPETSPHSVILQGGFGCGKTTQARILANELNGGKIYDELEQSPFYSEYDASMLKLDTLRQTIEAWYVGIKGGYRVIVLDECHALSRAQQTALLKPIEDGIKNTFFIFCTTDVDDVLPTIRSRSLEIRLTEIPDEPMAERVRKVAEENNISLTDKVVAKILENAHGHARNAMMELDKYQMLGEDEYLNVSKSSVEYVERYFKAIATKNKEECFKAIDGMMTYPIAQVGDDIRKYTKRLARELVGDQSELTKALGANTLKLVKLMISDWVTSSFKIDVEMQTALLCVYQIMTEGSARSQQVAQAPRNTAARR